MSLNNKQIITFGCRANQYQSAALQTNINSLIINTCMVTHDAERKSRQAIRRALRENPGKKIIITGCLVNLKKKELQEEFPEAELLAPPSFKSLKFKKAPRVRMNLMIQDGCENFCTYCIVPFARGKIKCKPLEHVIQEAKDLVAAGAREIILTGINLGTYKDVEASFSSPKNGSLKTAATLEHILPKLSKIKDLQRIRLSSIEPMYLTKELIDCIAETPKVCNFLHIPLQSGDNDILKAMNRNYTREDFIGLINYIRSKMPDCGVSTDIIVGFPGETEQQFKNTLDLVDKIKFSRIHIFPYSKRSGTKAAELPNHLNPKIIKQRLKQLEKLRSKYMQAFAQKYMNKEVEVLIERPHKGLTTNFIKVSF